MRAMVDSDSDGDPMTAKKNNEKKGGKNNITDDEYLELAQDQASILFKFEDPFKFWKH